jgi:hypothetical protein
MNCSFRIQVFSRSIQTLTSAIHAAEVIPSALCSALLICFSKGQQR